MIHPVIFRTTLRERVAAPGRWVGVLLLLIWPAILMAFMHTEQERTAIGSAFAFFETFVVWVAGAGLIGEDISSGTILLVLARPVRRSAYVFSKWLALTALAATMMVLQAVITGVVAWKLGAPADLAFLVRGAAISAVGAAGSAAVLVVFSVVAGNAKEMGGAMLTYAALSLLRVLAMTRGWSRVAALAESASGLLMPSLKIHAAFAGTGVNWGALGAFAFVTCASLTLAVVILNRRQLSYAAA